MSIITRQNNIINSFNFFETWMEKYSYLISLGNELEKLFPNSQKKRYLFNKRLPISSMVILPRKK